VNTAAITREPAEKAPADGRPDCGELTRSFGYLIDEFENLTGEDFT
jgi:hypothetical protein